jgi:hypothetical protein
MAKEIMPRLKENKQPEAGQIAAAQVTSATADCYS